MNEVAVIQKPDAMLEVIERLASNKDVDLSKMQALWEMRNNELLRIAEQNREENARVAKLEFLRDLVPMSNKLPLVVKGHENTFTKSKYAKHEDINEAVKPVLAEFGFALLGDVIDQTETTVTVEMTLVHRGGHQKSLRLTMPIDDIGAKGEKTKTGLHGMASTITYTKRIAGALLLNISTGDDVDGNREVKVVTNEQSVEIDLLLTETKADKELFLKYMGVDDVRHILATDYEKALASLRKSAAKRGKEKMPE